MEVEVKQKLKQDLSGSEREVEAGLKWKWNRSCSRI